MADSKRSPPNSVVASDERARVQRAIDVTLRARLPDIVAEVLARLADPEEGSPPEHAPPVGTPRQEWLRIAAEGGLDALDAVLPYEREPLVAALAAFGLDRERRARRWTDVARIRAFLAEGLLREARRHHVFLEHSTRMDPSTSG